MTNPIPDGHHAITPYLILRNASQAIAFYQAAFGARELFRLPGPGGTVAHAELEIGGSRIMMADESKDGAWRSPLSVGGSPVSMVLYVADVDATFRTAVAAGATPLREVADQFYGDRMGTVRDPFGHVWTIGTHLEDVSPEEMAKRAAAGPETG